MIEYIFHLNILYYTVLFYYFIKIYKYEHLFENLELIKCILFVQLFYYFKNNCIFHNALQVLKMQIAL